jgi:hypothetical protein
MRKRQPENLAVVQAPFDCGRDQPGELPGAVAGGLLQLSGQMGGKPRRQRGSGQRQWRLQPGGPRWVGRQQPVQVTVAAAHSHTTGIDRPPAARRLWL